MDVSGVTFADSMFLSVLVRLNQERRLRLAGPLSAQLLRLLEMTGVPAVFEVGGATEAGCPAQAGKGAAGCPGKGSPPPRPRAVSGDKPPRPHGQRVMQPDGHGLPERTLTSVWLYS